MSLLSLQIKKFKVDLRGAIDMHVHTGPDVYLRLQDYIEVARDAHNAGMRALVYKPLGSFPSMDKAHACELCVSGIRVFGGIVLDKTVRGLNKLAVSTAIKMGAKVIWMPLFDAQNTIEKERKAGGFYSKFYRLEKKGLSILGDRGELIPETKEILNVIAEAKDVILATSHLSPEESLVLIKEAKSVGINNVIVTHVNAEIIDATIEQQKEMAKSGAYLELTGAQYTIPGAMKVEDPRKTLETIKEIGASRCIISSDAGHPLNDPQIVLLRRFITILMALGVSESEIDLMLRQNPAKILNL